METNLHPYKKITTIEEHILQQNQQNNHIDPHLSNLLRSICLATKIVNREVNQAGLVDILGAANTQNATQDLVQRLDLISNEVFKSYLNLSGECAGVASEEDDDFVAFTDPKSLNAQYVVCIDPLDGSSNIDVNISIGTIFGIYKRISPIGQPAQLADFLQQGNQQVAAGYIIYSTSTMLVYTTGNTVDGFTLDPSIYEFCLSNPNITLQPNANTYSINESYKYKFPEYINQYLEYCKQIDKTTKRPYNLRYIGSMVADFHRNLIKGGVFLYPPLTTHPNGKLRLLYECNPIAFIAHCAGGTATNGNTPILNLTPTELHQRTPLYIGNANMVNTIHQYIHNPNMQSTN